MRKEFMLSGKMNVATTKVGAIKIITPADGPHIVLKASIFSSDKDKVSMTLLEDYSYTNGAESTLVPNNRSRTLSVAPKTVIKAHTDITAVAGPAALTLETVAVAAVTNELAMRGSWILKPGATYLLTISNQNAATAEVGYAVKLEE